MLTEVPRDLSRQVADCLMAREGLLTKGWYYDFGVVWRGMEQVFTLTGDARYLAYVRDAVDTFVGEDGSLRGYQMDAYNLDSICCGRALLFLYRQTGEKRYLHAAAQLREQLRRHPRCENGGFWHKACYPHQMWLDGLHMAMPFYTEYAFLAGEEDAVLPDVALQFTLAYKHTFDPATGLNRHGVDLSRQEAWASRETGQSAHAWGRAMGWYLLGLADALEIMQAHGRMDDALLEIFRAMCQKLLSIRVDGVWMQVLDCPERAGNYPESSATFLILCAIQKGIRLGLLDQALACETRRSYEAAVRQFIGRLRDGTVFVGKCCQGAGLGGRFYRDGSYDYYISEPITAYDLKATGAMIQAACEMERMGEEPEQ